MIRSKSRSGSVDLGQKNHYSSLFSRTLSASKLCRGDAIGQQIDPHALKSHHKKPPSNISNSSNNQVDRIMSMQLQMGEMEEELRRAKEKLTVVETDKYRALDQLREAKEAAREANMRADEGLSSAKKAGELIMEIDSLKKTLSDSRDESRTKDKKIDSLGPEIARLRQLEIALAEKDASLDKLSRELRDVKQRERSTMVLLSENKRRIYELEGELEKERKSGSRMADSLVLQGRQLEATIFQLEESKIETTSLHEKIDSLEELYKQNSREFDASPTSVDRNANSRQEQEQEQD